MSLIRQLVLSASLVFISSNALALKIGYFGDSTTLGTISIPDPGYTDYPVANMAPCVAVPTTGWHRYDTITPETELKSLRSGFGDTVIVDGQYAKQAKDLSPQFQNGSKLNGENYDVVIVNYGINDAGQNRSVAEYILDMKKIVEAAISTGAYVLIEKPNPTFFCDSQSRLNDMRAALSPAFSLYKNVKVIDPWAGITPSNWYATYMSDPLHPSVAGYKYKVGKINDEINAIGSWCSLTAPATVAGGTTPYIFTVRGNVIGSGYWSGTRNGIVDASLVAAGAVSSIPNVYNFTSSPSWEGTYTRDLTITPSSGPSCVTNSVTTRIMPDPTPTCTLSISNAVVPSGRIYAFSYLYNGASAAAYTAKWRGTKNGVEDETGTNAAEPSPITYMNQSGWAGSYVRYLDLYDGSGKVCTTNSVTIVLQ